MAGLTRPGHYEWVLPPLDNARVTKISEHGMLIVGVEQEGQRLNALRHYLQAWWVRLPPA